MKTIFSILAACAAFAATTASGSTISGWVAEDHAMDADNTLHDEFGAFYADKTIDHVYDDFSSNLGNPVLEFDDDAWIFGRVWDDYADTFQIDATNYSFDLQITAMTFDQTQIATSLSFGVEVWDDTTSIADYTTVNSNTWTATDLSGIIDIRLSAFSDPNRHNGSNVRYLVDVVNVSAVPLPTSSLLLLAGLGGLGAMSRRKKA